MIVELFEQGLVALLFRQTNGLLDGGHSFFELARFGESGAERTPSIRILAAGSTINSRNIPSSLSISFCLPSESSPAMLDSPRSGHDSLRRLNAST